MTSSLRTTPLLPSMPQTSFAGLPVLATAASWERIGALAAGSINAVSDLPVA